MHYIFIKDHADHWVAKRIIGYASIKVVLEVSAMVTGSEVVAGGMLK